MRQMYAGRNVIKGKHEFRCCCCQKRIVNSGFCQRAIVISPKAVVSSEKFQFGECATGNNIFIRVSAIVMMLPDQVKLLGEKKRALSQLTLRNYFLLIFYYTFHKVFSQELSCTRKVSYTKVFYKNYTEVSENKITFNKYSMCTPIPRFIGPKFSKPKKVVAFPTPPQAHSMTTILNTFSRKNG